MASRRETCHSTEENIRRFGNSSGKRRKYWMHGNSQRIQREQTIVTQILNEDGDESHYVFRTNLIINSLIFRDDTSPNV